MPTFGALAWATTTGCNTTPCPAGRCSAPAIIEGKSPARKIRGRGTLAPKKHVRASRRRNERLVAAGAAGGGRAGLLLHGDHLRRGLGGYGNGEDVLSGFNLAEDVLIANVLEGKAWFVFASRSDFTRNQQYALAIFNAGDGQYLRDVIASAIDAVGARGERFSRDHKVIRDVHNNLIEFLGLGGDSERSQPKKCEQDSDVNRFHHFSFCVVWSVVGDHGCPCALRG